MCGLDAAEMSSEASDCSAVRNVSTEFVSLGHCSWQAPLTALAIAVETKNILVVPVYASHEWGFK